MGTENDGAPSTAVDPRGGQGSGAGERRSRNNMLLIIEDDAMFARIVGDIAGRCSFKPIVAFRGDVGLAMARQFQPDAIVCDVRLPGLDGWGLLDQFKHDPSTRRLPVIIMSGDERGARARRRGAFDFMLKPVAAASLEAAIARLDAFISRPERNLLMVDGDGARRREMLDLVAGPRVRSTEVASGAEALQALQGAAFDCVITAGALPDITGRELVQKIARDEALSRTPIIVRTGGEAGPPLRVGGLLDAAIVREATSLEGLLDATTLFLHLVDEELTDSGRKLLERVRRSNPLLAGKRILIVDDDARNVFALKSLLEAHKMSILTAYSGKEGLDVLRRERAVDLVLMDVMMPEMDGYETIRAIRQVAAWTMLPIFALTAKAMKGDRERCLEAGASDYIAKPVDTAQLLSMLRVWLGP